MNCNVNVCVFHGLRQPLWKGLRTTGLEPRVKALAILSGKAVLRDFCFMEDIVVEFSHRIVASWGELHGMT